MATKLKEVDVVLVGLGWTGGILAKELSAAGMKVVALERGGMRTTESDYSVPHVRDELRFVHRHDLMQNTQKDTLTIRNNVKQEALPMRRLGSFLPGEVVGGSGVHWSGHTWRWSAAACAPPKAITRCHTCAMNCASCTATTSCRTRRRTR